MMAACYPCYGDIIAVVLTVLITLASMAAAYRIGRHVGYWRRVREEKSSRGIW